MIAAEREELRRLADACFDGPWVANTWTVECDHEEHCGYDHELETIITQDDEQVIAQVSKDDGEISTPGLERFAGAHAAFIAASRTAVSKLLDLVESQERELMALREVVDALAALDHVRGK